MKQRNCNRAGCPKTATKVGQFHLLPRVGDEPAIAPTTVFVCDEHATVEAGYELLNDNIPGRNAIAAHFEQRGMQVPDWTRSKTVWVPIEEAGLIDDEPPKIILDS